MLMQDALVAMDADSLKALAAALMRLADDARERARMVTERRRREVEAHADLRRLAGLAVNVADLVHAGLHHRAACDQVAAVAGVPVETVRVYWRSWCRSRDATTMEARRLVVVRKALAGARNAEIAASVGISLRTVERALAGLKWGKVNLVKDF